jgi:hypothetical protein
MPLRHFRNCGCRQSEKRFVRTEMREGSRSNQLCLLLQTILPAIGRKCAADCGIFVKRKWHARLAGGDQGDIAWANAIAFNAGSGVCQ